jgi:hypothetical protein
VHDVSYDVCLGVAFDLLPRPLVNSRLAGQGRAAWLADSVARARRPPLRSPGPDRSSIGASSPAMAASEWRGGSERSSLDHACMHARSGSIKEA